MSSRWYNGTSRWSSYGGSSTAPESAHEKRRELVEQCLKAGIPATMGRSKGETKGRKRIKATTIGKMRRTLIAKGKKPCC